MSQQVEYQDPILTPGNLRKIVQNLPGKAKDQHTEYEYHCDADTFENEINEFFKYTEVTVQLQEYRKLYEKKYNGGTMRRQDIVLLLDQLELSDQESRLKASKLLVYIALGSFTMNKKESNQDRIQKLMENANLLIECGAFNIFYQKLQQSLDSWIELDLYLGLLYVLLESQRDQYPSKSSKKFKLDLVTLEPNLTGFLLSLVAKLREKLNTSFPVKKVILLLWKSLLFMSGGLEGIKESNLIYKKSFGLSTNPNIISKSTPQDLHLFQTQITDKYPGYIAPGFPIDISSPLTLHASSALSQAMGYTNATNQIELLYQTLFPPKSSSVNGTSVFLANKKSNHQVQQYFMYPSHVSPTFALPLTHQGSSVPESIKEAGQVFEKHMHTSLSNYQIIQERSKGIQKWKLIEETKDDHYKIELQDDDSIDLLEKIYARIFGYFYLPIVLLLTSVNTSNNNQDDVKEKINTPENITLEHLEEVDFIRNREVYSKAISGILLLLLKWTKSSHVLKFEYISQLLVDSGCLLLILKIIGLQEITDLVKAQTDVPYYSFFDYNINRDPNSIESLPTSVTNRRNMFWAINYLRVLQMLTKHKIHRVMLLAQYKSSAILKRMLKISHPVLELYTLKLLKSQVPYLGRKWRSRKENMRIISAIYLNCYTVLKDDWISKINFDEDLEEGKMQEHNLRILTCTYNGERYMPSLLPLHDEVNTEKGCTPTGPGFSGFDRYDINNLSDDEEELDQVFLKDYKVWLESEKFYNGTEEEIVTDTQVDTPAAISTPYPFHTPDTISHQQLTQEINKLYLQQLDQQFQSTVSTDTWESPPTPSKLLTPLTTSRYQAEQRTDDEEYVQDAEDLMYQLMQVEDTTVKKWNDLQPAETKYRYILFDDELYYSPDIAATTSEDDDNSQYSGTRG
ncbi:hypothetical protein HPULCUR_003517 [Helicostylum pulchrum]|uniref:Uncharacterized protein n=1 Tax=Helicostylum pulchrum TaxID=562976 RepID=A0ABP9XTM4_9FUNG